MTEAEWLKQTNPECMLEFFGGTVGDRKLRLFACACSRRVWRHLPKIARTAVEAAECFADGAIELGQLEKAHRRVCQARANWEMHPALHASSLRNDLSWTPREVVSLLSRVEVGDTGREPPGYGKGEKDKARRGRRKATRRRERYEDVAVPEVLAQTHLVHDIFGNPFRPVPLNPYWLAWNDGTLRKMAQAIYDERAFDRLPLLADALEEAGCADREILDHCRSGGEHVRGCWVVDLLLGKA